MGRPDRRPAGTARHVHDRRERRGQGRQPRLRSAPSAPACDGRRARRRGRRGAPGRDRAFAHAGRLGHADRRQGRCRRAPLQLGAAATRRRARRSRPLDRGAASRFRYPEGPATAYVLTVRTHGEVARAVIPVAAPRPRPVLVVLPALTWQGRNDVDDDGDGLPDSLARERRARVQRPFAGGRLPVGFRANEANLLAYLDRQGLRYELTTDLALARAGGAPLVGAPGRDPRRGRALAARAARRPARSSSSAAAGGSSRSASTRFTGRWRWARGR